MEWLIGLGLVGLMAAAVAWSQQKVPTQVSAAMLDMMNKYTTVGPAGERVFKPDVALGIIRTLSSQLYSYVSPSDPTRITIRPDPTGAPPAADLSALSWVRAQNGTLTVMAPVYMAESSAADRFLTAVAPGQETFDAGALYAVLVYAGTMAKNVAPPGFPPAPGSIAAPKVVPTAVSVATDEIPADLLDLYNNLLQNGTDPNQLLFVASELDAVGAHTAAEVLRKRSASLTATGVPSTYVENPQLAYLVKQAQAILAAGPSSTPAQTMIALATQLEGLGDTNASGLAAQLRKLAAGGQLGPGPGPAAPDPKLAALTQAANALLAGTGTDPNPYLFMATQADALGLTAVAAALRARASALTAAAQASSDAAKAAAAAQIQAQQDAAQKASDAVAAAQKAAAAANAQAQQLIAQANQMLGASPGTVTSAALLALAVQLDAANQTALAAQLRALAAQLSAAQTQPAAPPPAQAAALSPLQKAAAAMNLLLSQHDYVKSDQPFYMAFQQAAGLSADGYPGGSTYDALARVIATIPGTTLANVKRYPWSGARGDAGYDGVNAPQYQQWYGQAPAAPPGTAQNVPTPAGPTGFTGTSLQIAAQAMSAALASRGYRKSDQYLYKAFQSAAGLGADGYPGPGTMGKLSSALASLGQSLPPGIHVYPWKGSGAYDGVNAPPAAQWNQ